MQRGDGFNMEISSLDAKFCGCNYCGSEFRSVGKKVTCHSCHSTRPVFNEE